MNKDRLKWLRQFHDSFDRRQNVDWWSFWAGALTMGAVVVGISIIATSIERFA